ncbi:MAG: Slp family lipoprotein [Thiotrichales bacterium]
MMKIRSVVLGVALAALGGCASGPQFPVTEEARAYTPDAMAAAPATGKAVVWGGMIISASNQRDSTRLEVLGYPLDGSQRPDTSRPAQTRFFADRPGYLETADYSNGRLVTVSGVTREVVKGKIGEAEYSYPRVEVDQIHLWSIAGRYGDVGSRVQFGIGVMIGN